MLALVELLDHQKTLRQHHIPGNAIYLLKKTGIVDDSVGENDIFDNHFLYVMVRRMVMWCPY